MPYSKARLLEALQVIRKDNNRLHVLEADKLARTQYRDGFHLRKPTSTTTQPRQLWRQDDSSDEEYNPFKKKNRKPKKSKDDEYDEDCARKKSSKVKTKRRFAAAQLDTDQEDQPDDHDSKRQKLEDLVLPLNASSGFVTISFKSVRAQLFLLQKLKSYEDTNINIYYIRRKEAEERDPSSWRLSSGSLLHGSNRLISQHISDYEVATALEESLEELILDTPRTLRSGKVRAEVVSKKRDIDEVDDGDDSHQNTSASGNPHNDDQNYQDNKRCKLEHSTEPVDNQLDDAASVPRTPSGKSAHSLEIKIHSGAKPDDAISISSSSPPQSRAATPDTSPLSGTDQPPPLTQHDQANLVFLPRPHSAVAQINTSFSHPINFHSHATCSFHSDYRHPIRGHGLITADYIIDPRQPSQLIETGNGHRSEGIPPDTMCILCSLAYIQITRCATHTFTRLPRPKRNAKAQNKIFEAYVQDLYLPPAIGDPRRTTEAPFEICKLCPAPATHKCCTPQQFDESLNPCRLPHETVEAARARVDNAQARCLGGSLSPSPLRVPQVEIMPPKIGCGLILCSTCRDLVRDRCQGRLQGNRDLILNELRGFGMGSRADSEFLFREGLVWKAYHVDVRR